MAIACIIKGALAASLFVFVQSLYEDQAGTYDWKQDYVGRLTHVHWEGLTSGSSGKKLFVATEQNVLAGLNSHDGTIAWRQVAEENERGKFNTVLYSGSNLLTAQAGGKFVRNWHSPTGNLVWEKYFPGDESMNAPAIFLNADKDYVVVATSNALNCIKVSDGKTEWEANLPDSDTVHKWYLSQQTDGDLVAVGVSPGLRVAVVILGQGGTVKSQRKVPAPWIQNQTSCEVVGDEAFLCYAPDLESLQYLSLPESQVFVPYLLSDFGLSSSAETSLLKMTTEPGKVSPWVLLRLTLQHLVLLNVSASDVKIAKDLNKVEAADMAFEGDTQILVTVQRADPETVIFSGLDLATMVEHTDISQRITVMAAHGTIEKVFPMFFTKKKDGKLGAKILMVAQDYSLHCTHKPGKLPWRREEALAYIIAVEMVDLPVSENEAKFEDEFGSSKDDIVAMFVKRIKVQVLQLRGFVEHLIQKLLGHRHHHSVISKNDAVDANEEEDEEDEEEDLVRDAFSLHKMIVAVTSAGKVYGIRSHSGKIAWQHFFPDLSPFTRYGQEKLLLFVQRTTAHFPHAPQCAVLGVNKKSGNGLLYTINPVTGALLKDTLPNGLDLDFKVIQAHLLDLHDQDFLKGVMLIDSNIKIHFFPSTMKTVVRPLVDNMYFHLINIDTGYMDGFRLVSMGEEILAQKVWNIDLQRSQQVVTGVYSKRAIEHVHSQGRVLGDRSVLYKYLNPNLVVLTTEGEEPASVSSNKGPSGFFNLYLVDGVTGNIVFHENHKRTHGPVNVVHSENWVVYSFYSEKHRRCEMAVLELYEGKEQSNATAFSSLAPPPNPLVMRQSYVFQVPLYTMASTVTEKGITNKNIIIALKIGGVLSLPKALLDPRRPSIPTQETMEEGTIPYSPELSVSLENVVNYNQSIFNVRGIHTAPAGLESTSLILVYGIDVFYTRVMPSKMFDVLKEDFDYLFIGGVLLIMILVSFISQKLAARRALNRAWK